MSSIVRYQPFKALYILCQLLATVFIRFPAWFILALPSSNRPRKSFTISRVLLVNAIRFAFKLQDTTGPIIVAPDHRAIKAGKGVNGVWVPAVSHLVTGNLKLWASVAKVQSVRLPGYWLLKDGATIKPSTPPLPDEKVIYNLHGGAYIRMSAHPSDPTANIPKGYLQHVQSVKRVFSLEYRLASSAPNVVQHPFPTQLLDALAGYNYLVKNIGFKPENIIVSGDSAGANLALALVRYLRDNAGATDVELPAVPGGLILLSPWADMGTSSDKLYSTLNFTSSDYIRNDGGITYAKKSFCGPHGLGIADTNEYISPASLHTAIKVDFKGFPRTFLVNGGAEILHDCIANLKTRIAEDLGDELEYYEAPDGIHDYICFTLHEPERTDTLKAINKWFLAKSS